MTRVMIAMALVIFTASIAPAGTYVDANGKMHLHIGDAQGDTDLPRYSNPSEPIETESGKVFVIVLDANPTTGYQWQLDKERDTLAIELVGVEYIKEPGDMVGSGGKENWTFKALKFRKDRVGLVFKYVRPWEKDVPPVKVAVFSVIINRNADEQQLASMQRELEKMRNERWEERIGQ